EFLPVCPRCSSLGCTRWCACYLQWYSARRDLHSFPTRRSSDLSVFTSRFRAVPESNGDVSMKITAISTIIEWDAEAGRMVILNPDRKSTRLNSSHVKISYAVFCLKKKNKADEPKPPSDV